MTARTDRSALDVFTHHAQAMTALDLEDIVADYADDARFVTPDGVLRGRAGVRAGFTKLFGELPRPRFDVRTRILDGDMLFLEWSAAAEGAHADDGVETFLVRDGEIVLQTVHYTAQPGERRS
jgi:ketosteroid isomerase-like protein